MICFDCYSKMIPVTLVINKHKHDGAQCINCGKLVTKRNEKRYWTGEVRLYAS